MKAKVDKELCIGCELCTTNCSSVFEMDDDGIAYVKTNPVPAEFEACTLEAEEECPVEAISHED